MRDGIKKAHQEDAKTPDGQGKLYGVYDYADWNIQSDEIEEELRARQEVFEPVPWKT